MRSRETYYSRRQNLEIKEGKFAQNIHSSRYDTKGKRCKKESGPDDTGEEIKMRDEPYNLQWKDSGKESKPSLSEDINTSCCNDKINPLKYFFTNANSLIGKIEEFRKRVRDCMIAAVVETLACDDIADSELVMNGFNMYRLDRESEKGGGVIIYVKNSLNSILCFQLMNTSFEESVWCIIELRNKSRLLLWEWCRSTASTESSNGKLFELLDAALRQHGITHKLIIGDFQLSSN